MPHRMVLAFSGALMWLNSAVAGDLQQFATRCLEARAKAATVRILQFGDSHLVLPRVQRCFQEAFQAQLGDGGPGFGLPWVKPMSGVRSRASSGWHRPSKGAAGAMAGFQNAWFEAARPGEAASLEGGFSHLRIHFQSLPGGGSAKILVDGRFLEEISLQGNAPELRLFERDLPGSRRLEVVISRPGPVRILGLSLEAPSGAVHSVMAANGLQASWMLAIPESLFEAQVRAEAPDLVVLAFGTNEANDRSFDPGVYRKDLRELLSRFQKAAPEGAVVLVGPPDAQLPRSLPGALDRVVEVQRSLAADQGAFFWDQRAAMGGVGSVAAWSHSGLANRDLIHFTLDGYQRLAWAFLDRFFAGLTQFPTPQGAFRVFPRPMREETPALLAHAAQPRTGDRPIRVFKTRDGRTIITDDPATVAGEQGEWEGRSPE